MLALVRVLCTAILFAAFGASAQASRKTPIRHGRSTSIVPYPPGGAVDIVARTLGDALGEALESVGRHREPAGRRRHRCRAGFGAGAAGRLHADPRRLRATRCCRISTTSCPTTRSRILRRSRRSARRPTCFWCAPIRRFKSVGDVIAAARAKPGVCPTATPATAPRLISPANCSNTWRRSRSRRCRIKAVRRL